MDDPEYIANYGSALLDALLDQRDKLISQLAREPLNLEEKMFDVVIDRLGAVQGCITATREAIDDAKTELEAIAAKKAATGKYATPKAPGGAR
jgi:hypothetical protein